MVKEMFFSGVLREGRGIGVVGGGSDVEVRVSSSIRQTKLKNGKEATAQQIVNRNNILKKYARY